MPFAPQPDSNLGRAQAAWLHINRRLSVDLGRYVSNADKIALAIRKSPQLKTRRR